MIALQVPLGITLPEFFETVKLLRHLVVACSTYRAIITPR